MSRSLKGWLILLKPVYSFLFLILDGVTKKMALTWGYYTLTPHFLSVAISSNAIVLVEVLLVIIFALYYFFPKFFFHAEQKYRRYFFGDFWIHALILGSIFSNAFDLTRRGGIVDWIDLGIIKTNLADIGIITGISVLLYRSVKPRFTA